MFELSERMKMNAELVPDGCCLADIGCDHAYVSITLAKQKRCKKIIALDVNKGPLAIAKKNIDNYKVQDIVSCRLSDGMEQLVPGEVDTLLIAGMGGMLICRILNAKPDVLACIDTLILQPQSDYKEIRSTLWKLGFRIDEECACCDAGKDYLSIRAVRGREKNAYSEAETTYGRILPKKKDSGYYKHLFREREKAREILQKLDSHNSESACKQKEHLQKTVMLVDEIVKQYYEG